MLQNHYSETAHSGEVAEERAEALQQKQATEERRELNLRHFRIGKRCLSGFMDRRRKWEPTPVFLPGESQGRGSLVGCHLWGRTESDLTEVT